ncbi:MAG: hypothetical protein OEN50_01860 [Deltaproteobacteria bacterium]|nr:hypothetical protein [Deltaproteobacteria bacterium]
MRGVFGHTVPVYFLDTGLDDNDLWERDLTDALYNGNARTCLCQEIVLGMGSVAMLETLGHKHFSTYHMNEGHAALSSSLPTHARSFAEPHLRVVSAEPTMF